MPDAKISALTALLGADVADGDLFVIVDVSAGSTKKITAAQARTAIGSPSSGAAGALQASDGAGAFAAASNANVVAAMAAAGVYANGLKVAITDIAKADILLLHSDRYPIIPALGENMLAWVLRSFALPISGVVGYSGGGAVDLFYGGFYEPNIYVHGSNTIDALKNEITPGINAGTLGIAEFGTRSSLCGPNNITQYIFSANQPVYIRTHANTPFEEVADGVISAAINASGSGYQVNDFLTVDGGNADADIIVRAVDGLGGITSALLFDGGSGGYSSGTANVSNGNGTGATFDIVAGASNAVMRVYTLYIPINLFPS